MLRTERSAAGDKQAVIPRASNMPQLGTKVDQHEMARPEVVALPPGASQIAQPNPDGSNLNGRGQPPKRGSSHNVSAKGTTGTGNRTPIHGSLAKQRGANWSTPDSNRGLTGITRPIMVVCHPDRLVILPERGERTRPIEVLLPGETRSSIDDFANQIWKSVDRWGLAVAGGHWKPLLHVQVAPGADDRFADMQSLLEDSGIEVKRQP